VRYEAVCFDCPDWVECSGCTIESSDVTPTCVVPLEHTKANQPGLTLETLSIDGGYWRTTAESDNILACHNPDACSGGQTGTDSFCASGYKGPCEGVGEKASCWSKYLRTHALDCVPSPDPPFALVLAFIGVLVSIP